ncbi:hypothetical protein F2P45_00530 [Massilia sp. CCM 8733]|uniref:Tetratricopeptide repeat protein n=1 Tax=Massilia mucilaginosa TaxID=2609282 RepID=A0ABX0NL43_9BURK|nr:hypothetical protein [Massilia mucilaginosa]NHZ87525.1 hypothetical protein [Massilia mucilaginosa]
MTTHFSILTTWDGVPRMSDAAFFERFPDWLDESEEGGSVSCFLLAGNISVSTALLEELGDDTLIVVDGSLRIDAGNAHGYLLRSDAYERICFVSGDLHVEAAVLDGMRDDMVGGRIVASSAWLLAEDFSAMREAPAVRIETQFLFVWFYEIDTLTLNPDAVVFIIGEGDYCARLELPNPLFCWHEGVFALDAKYLDKIDCDSSNSVMWQSTSIILALRAGRSLFMDGVDVASNPYHTSARAAMATGERRAAYLLHKKSAAISPAYYEAWFGMGQALMHEGAWRQALEMYRKAAALFPRRQTGMVNTALSDAALCALRSAEPAQAIELAGMAILHNQDCYYKEPEAAEAYCHRAEAYLMTGQADAALADLGTALELDPHLTKARWLTGLAHYQRNEPDLARAAHASASEANARYAPFYDIHPDTGFLYRGERPVDWDRVDAASIALPVKDEAYWLNYMLRDAWASLKRVPPAWRTDALCQAVAAACGPSKLDYARYLPDSAFTRAIAETLMAAWPGWLERIPPRLIDKALIMLARPGARHFSLAHVPADVIDAEVCLRAVQCGESIANIPPEYVDKALCLACVTAHPSHLEQVSPHLIDDDVIAAAIAHGDERDFDRLPDRYTSAALLELAVNQYKCALDAIPGHRVDAALFAFAAQRYGSDADWPAIVARHGRDAIERDAGADCAAQCWNVFWTEPFMLAQIARKSGGLRPYNIPDASFTQALAKACLTLHPAYFYCIPKRWVTQSMSNAASKDRPGEIEHIPVAQRTRAICERAIENDAATALALVPLALRSVAMCVAAMRADGDDNLVPGALYREVIDTLIEQHSDEFNAGWLYLSRAEGALRATPPRIDLAIADYQFVADATEHAEVDEESREHAREALAALQSQTPEQWASGDLFDFVEPSEPVDFDRRRYDRLMEDLMVLVRRGDNRHALPQVEEAERMLLRTGHSDVVRWAYLLDKKIHVASELGRWDVLEASCRAAIARLGKERLWQYLAEHDTVRHTLRWSYFRLGTMREHHGLPLAELQADLALVEKALALIGPTEDASVLDPFRKDHAALLGILAERELSYKAAYHAAAALTD